MAILCHLDIFSQFASSMSLSLSLVSMSLSLCHGWTESMSTCYFSIFLVVVVGACFWTARVIIVSHIAFAVYSSENVLNCKLVIVGCQSCTYFISVNVKCCDGA